jgi:hypothetical protein
MITLKDLSIQEVEFIIGALSKGEYLLVSPIIDKIKVQAIPQAHAILQTEADAKAQEVIAEAKDSKQDKAE